MANEPDMTTVRLSKETVAFMKTQGRYEESLADIAQRLFVELQECREKLTKIGDHGPLCEAEAMTA
jgi:hypothetical protein